MTNIVTIKVTNEIHISPTFRLGGAKIGEKQSRQSNSKYNFMQYVYF